MKDACSPVTRGICEGIYVRLAYASMLGCDCASVYVHALVSIEYERPASFGFIRPEENRCYPREAPRQYDW